MVWSVRKTVTPMRTTGSLSGFSSFSSFSFFFSFASLAGFGSGGFPSRGGRVAEARGPVHRVLVEFGDDVPPEQLDGLQGVGWGQLDRQSEGQLVDARGLVAFDLFQHFVGVAADQVAVA